MKCQAYLTRIRGQKSVGIPNSFKKERGWRKEKKYYCTRETESGNFCEMHSCKKCGMRNCIDLDIGYLVKDPRNGFPICEKCMSSATKDSQDESAENIHYSSIENIDDLTPMDSQSMQSNSNWENRSEAPSMSNLESRSQSTRSVINGYPGSNWESRSQLTARSVINGYPGSEIGSNSSTIRSVIRDSYKQPERDFGILANYNSKQNRGFESSVYSKHPVRGIPLSRARPE